MIVAASDYLKVLPGLARSLDAAPRASLGTDGFGRSEDRDRPARASSRSTRASSPLATLAELAQEGQIDARSSRRRSRISASTRRSRIRRQLTLNAGFEPDRNVQPEADARQLKLTARPCQPISHSPNSARTSPRGDVVRVLVAAGDSVKKDQPVLELETDKATIEVPSTRERHGQRGQGQAGRARSRSARSC